MGVAKGSRVLSERKIHAVTAARHLFATRGIDRTTMADIAARVGVVESALYRHFASKADLIRETIRYFYEPIIKDIEAASLGIADPVALTRYVIWRHLRSYVEEPELIRLVIVSARQSGDASGAEISELNRRYTSVLIRAVKAGMDSGRFRADLDPRLVRDMVYGLIEHTWLRYEAHGDTIDVDGLAEQIFQLILPTLVASAPTTSELQQEIRRLSQLIARVAGESQEQEAV